MPIVPASRGQLAVPVSRPPLSIRAHGQRGGNTFTAPPSIRGPRQARVKACGDSSRWRGDSSAPACLRLPPPARGDATAAFRCCRREAQTGGVGAPENSLHLRLLCF